MNPQARIASIDAPPVCAATAASLSRMSRNRSLFDRDWRLGSSRAPLRGKQLALLCEDSACPDARLFCSVAEEFGAQVSWLRPSVARLTPAVDVDAAALWLSRLYDGIECHGLPPEIVARLRISAHIPVAQVVDGLLIWDRATDGQSPPLENRLQALQVLIASAFG